jgi:hypothetical protein
MNLDHTHVTEQLAAYVRDELGADQAAAVRAHLEECDQCRSEWIGVRALASLPEERLGPSERVALRDAVRARVQKKTWSRRLAPALGAVGLIAVVVVGAATILSNGIVGTNGDGDSGEAQVADDDATEEQALDAESAPAPAPAGKASRSEDKAVSNQAATSAAGTAAGPGAEQADALFSATLRYAEAGPLRPHLLSARDTDGNAFESPRRTLGRLLRVAPNGRWAEQITTCNDAVTSFLPTGARAAYAAVYPTDRLLVMGFVWSEEEGLRYAFWGWPAGDCSVVAPIYASGSL